MSSAADSGIIIGIGHAERQDDGVGPFVAQRLHERGLPAVVHEGDGTALLDLWEGRRSAIAIDAIAGDAAPGTIHLFIDFDEPDFARAAFVHSTHRLGLPEAIALGRSLGRMPERLVIVGITGASFGFGRILSPPVEAAANRLIEHLASTEAAFGADPAAALRSLS